MIGDKDGKTMIKLGDFGWAVNAKNGFRAEAYAECVNNLLGVFGWEVEGVQLSPCPSLFTPGCLSCALPPPRLLQGQKADFLWHFGLPGTGDGVGRHLRRKNRHVVFGRLGVCVFCFFVFFVWYGGSTPGVGVVQSFDAVTDSSCALASRFEFMHGSCPFAGDRAERAAASDEEMISGTCSRIISGEFVFPQDSEMYVCSASGRRNGILRQLVGRGHATSSSVLFCGGRTNLSFLRVVLKGLGTLFLGC